MITNMKNIERELDQELELNDEQSERNDTIHQAVYDLCIVMTQDEDLEWDMEYIGEIADCVASILTSQGKKVRYPSVMTNPDGTQYIEEYYGE